MRRTLPRLLSHLTKIHTISKTPLTHLIQIPLEIPNSPPFHPPCRPILTLTHHPDLEPATTTDQILAAFASLESSTFDEDDPNLGLACLNVSHHLDSTGHPDKALDFAVRALKILERSHGAGSLSVVKALCLVGSIGRKLKRLEDSLESLSTAEQILGRLKEECLPQIDILETSVNVQDELARTKTEMGRPRDALINLRRSMEMKVSILDPNCEELGAAYKDLAEAYVAVLEFKEALPLCLKALEIYEASMEVVQIRRLIGVVYTGLGMNEDALEQNEILRMIVKCSGSEEEVLDAEIEAANIQIALGRWEEAIGTLKGAVPLTGRESETRALLLISMAKALCGQEKFGDAKRCLEISCGIFDKLESVAPAKVAGAYADTSMLYETMAEFEIALSLMKRTLAILEKLPQERHLEGSILGRIGWLLLLTGRVPQAVPYLESAVERLKDSFGLKHFGLGFVYKHLGHACLEMNSPQSAVKMLTLAKDIICASFGPHHEDSIDTYQCLANAYGAMGSYALAMEFQQRVLDAWESHGPSAKNEFREAHRLLEQLKKKAQGSPSAVFPANALPLPK